MARALHDRCYLSALLWAWLVYITAHTFLYIPVAGAGMVWIVLAIPALYALTPRIKGDVKSCGVILTIYAVWICAQAYIFHGEIGPYSFSYVNGSDSWPLRDPNNAACIFNIGLISCVGMMQRRIYWTIPAALFALALIATGSTAGWLAACVCCALLVFVQYPWSRLYVALAGAGTGVFLLIHGFSSLKDRFVIWDTTWQMIKAHPWGIGINNFFPEYLKLRENVMTQQSWFSHGVRYDMPAPPQTMALDGHSAGYFAHNDLLQIIAETGWLGGALFMSIIAYIALRTRKVNIVPACVMLAILLQALVEFQFYVPSIAILLGVAMVSWRDNSRNI